MPRGTTQVSQDPLQDLDPLQFQALLQDQLRRPAGRFAPLRLDGGPSCWSLPLRTAHIRQALPEASNRIQQLIGHLEDVSQISTDAVAIEDLAQEGAAAIGPLCDCIAHDQRLTRANDRLGRVIPVWWIAYRALGQILQDEEDQPDLFPDTLRWRQSLICQLHDRVADHRHPWDHWCRMLADDHASDSQWVLAASRLTAWAETQPITIRSQPNQQRAWDQRLGLAANPLCSITDAPRHGRDTTLLAGRLQSVLTYVPNPFGGTEWTAAGLATALAAWDGSHQLSLLRRTQARMHDWLQAGQWWSDPEIVLTLERAVAGDASALDEYARWLRQRPSAPVGSIFVRQPVDLLPALWFPQHPGMQEALLRMWSPDPGIVPPTFPPLTTAVFTLPAVQQLLQAGIMGSDQHTSDACAAALAQVEGFPSFDADWTDSRKQAALARCRDTFLRYAPWYTEVEVPIRTASSAPDLRINPVWLQPPPLHQPATAADVAAGRAVFSLLGAVGAQVRAVEGWDRHLYVQWTSYRAEVLPPASPGLPAKAAPTDLPPDRGHVIQMEEIRTPTGWKCWAGLVLPHDLVQVPADQLELGYQRGTWRIGAAWDLSLSVADDIPYDINGIPRFGPGRKPSILVHLRNGLMLPRAAPRIVSSDRSGPGSWSNLVQPELWTCANDGPITVWLPVDVQHGWRPVAPKKPLQSIDLPSSAVMMAPGEHAPAEVLSLDDWFPVSAGTYFFRIIAGHDRWQPNKGIFFQVE